MDSSLLIHLVTSLDLTVLVILGVLLGEFRLFNFLLKNLWLKIDSAILLWDVTSAKQLELPTFS
jgi:hypothetical protein